MDVAGKAHLIHILGIVDLKQAATPSAYPDIASGVLKDSMSRVALVELRIGKEAILRRGVAIQSAFPRANP